jgi:hypothetical protein
MNFLFGTVAGEFADQNLFESRRSGQCLTFGPDPGADLHIGPDDSWTDICAKLPADWRPDLVALWLHQTGCLRTHRAVHAQQRFHSDQAVSRILAAISHEQVACVTGTPANPPHH